MLKIIIFLSSFLLSAFCYGMSAERWHKLSLKEKTELHNLLLKNLSGLDSKTSMNPKLYTSAQKHFREIASERKCIYGGWISTVKSGSCRHPYKGTKKYQLCGLKNVHRCNPIIFGESDQNSVSGSNPGKGPCVRATVESSSITWACIKSAYGSSGKVDVEKFRRHLLNLEGNKRYLGEYLAMAAEIIENHCDGNSNDFCIKNMPRNSCHKLQKSFFSETSANPSLIACRTREEILLEEIEIVNLEIKKTLDIYFPLIEESKIWEKIKNEKQAVYNFKSEEFWKHPCNPYSILFGHQPLLKKTKNCNKEKTLLEEKMIGETSWGSISLNERAERIYQLAHESYEDIKVATKRETGSFISKLGKFKHEERNDGNIFHDQIKPDVAACVIYHETKDFLHPFKYNYTFCQKRTFSTAYGLGQITQTTLKGFVDVNGGSNLPLITDEAKKFYWPGYSEEAMDGEDIYRFMSLSPKFQVELVLRILNEKAKYDRVDNMSDFRKLVDRYYGCNEKYKTCRESKKLYIKNVNSCVKCFRKGRPASDCYGVVE